MDKSGMEKQIRDALLASKNDVFQCELCEEKAVFRGVFIPTEEASKKLNAPSGKHRCVIYGLCRKCQSDPFADLKVESALFKSQARAQLRPTDD